MTAALQLLANPKSFRAVINKRFFKPRMLQGFLGSDAVFGIVDEDPLKKVQELSVETGVGRDEFLR